MASLPTPPTTAEAGVSTAELAVFTRQLGAMLAAGVDVLRALRIASQHTGNDRVIAAARDIALRLEDGREFHQAVAPNPQLFNRFYVEMTRQGEADGQLGQALLAVAEYLERSAGITGETSVAPAGTVSSGVAALTMSTLGVLALGAGVVWAVAAADILPIQWLGPVAVLWSGFCLLCGSWLLRRVRQPAALPPISPLPPKTQERRVAETEAVVRSALDEQQEAEEAAAPPEPGLKPKQGPAPRLNGKTPHPTASEPSESEDAPPRFQL
jgi:hypothetical protein